MSLGRQEPKFRRRLSKIFKKSNTSYIPEHQLPSEEKKFNANLNNDLFDHFNKNNIENYEEIKKLKNCIDVATKGIETSRMYITKKRTDIDQRTVIINLSGTQFRTKIANLFKYPTSRLGRISLATSYKQISDLCDGFIPGQTPTIYFDRNPQHFRTILDVYRSGEIHICEQSCALVDQEDFNFWGLNDLFLQPCCALKYFPHTVSAKKELEEEARLKLLAEEREIEENFGNTNCGRIRSFLWDLLEYPETSRLARIVAFISIIFVFISTATFMMESSFEKDMDHLDEFVFDKEIDNAVLNIIKVIDSAAITFFTAEYCVRLIMSPNKKKFLLCPINFIDFIAIVPFYLSILLEGLEDMQIIGKASKIIRLVRVMRILRIFKMVRHFVGIQSLLYTLHQAYKELGLLLLLVLVTVLMFSSLVFAFEREGPRADQWSFYDSIWWGLMTLTTVGYHRQPETVLGKLVCGLCALCGIFILTLPIPIVVSSFAVCYKSKLWRNEISTRKRLARGKNNTKSDILFNLATSGGMSGVRKESEILCHTAFDAQEYDQHAVIQNKYVMANSPLDLEDKSLENVVEEQREKAAKSIKKLAEEIVKEFPMLENISESTKESDNEDKSLENVVEEQREKAVKQINRNRIT